MSLGIGFKLNEQQVELLEQVTDFLIDKDNQCFTISGYAGTGKSSVVKILLKWIDVFFGFFDYEITAPTHRAKAVIEALSGHKSKTIQSILGLMPNINLDKLDMRNVEFNTSKEPLMPKHLLVIDEASMINDTLFNLILEKSRKKQCQVIFIGDIAQLKPVKQNHVSKIFKVSNRYELTKVERQKDGNPLGDLLFKVRSDRFAVKLPFELVNNINDKGEGVLFYDNSQEFKNINVELIQKIIKDEDYLNSRILCFKNDRVALYNKIIRKSFGFTEDYHQSEVLMAYDNVGEPEENNGVTNSVDYIITNKPRLVNYTLCGEQVKVWMVDLMTTDRKNWYSTLILHKDTSFLQIEAIGCYIEDLRLRAKNCKNRFEKMSLWKKYFDTKDSFLSVMDITYEGRSIKSKSIDYGYAITIHKSQGSTFKNVSVDLRDVMTCFDVETRNQLLYVALSRPTTVANIFH